jgi:hypothetical protein
VTTPALVPSGLSNVETTVIERERICPFVVSEFAAQRRLVSLCSLTITTQPSAADAASALSINSCGCVVMSGHLRRGCSGR